MRRHLELTSTKSAQQAILLNQLPNWEASQLDEKLESLQSKGIINISSNDPLERTISIEGLSEEVLKEIRPSINDEEKELLILLEKYISSV